MSRANLTGKTVEDANKELHIVVREPEDQVLSLDLQHLLDTSGFQDSLGIWTARFANNFNADGGRIDDRQGRLLLQAEDRWKELDTVQLATERLALHLWTVS